MKQTKIENSLIEILDEARDQGIIVFLEENKVRLRVAKEKQAAPETIALLKAHKDEIRDFLLAQQQEENTSKVQDQITPFDRNKIKKVPLSYAQERLWFLCKLQQSANYHVPAVLRLKGALDVHILDQSFEAVVDRHEVLKTTFREIAGKAYQEVAEQSNWELIYKEEDQSLDEQQRAEQIANEINRPFNLSRDCMIRARLFKINATEYLLVLVMHHIASDGWSLPIFVKDLMEFYQANLENRAAQLPTPALQYADYALWQREFLEAGGRKEQMDYWKKQLQNIKTLELPTDYPRPAIQSTRGNRLRFSIDPALYQQLEKLCKEEGVTLYMLLLTVIKVLLYRYSGQDDISVGCPVANRTRTDIEQLVGFFVNTLVVRSLLANDPGFRDLLAQVKQTTLDAYSNQDIPFEQIVQTIGHGRDVSRNPLFQVMLVLQNNATLPELKLGAIELQEEPFDFKTSKFDLLFTTITREGTLEIDIEYCSDLFMPATIEKMRQHIINLFQAIVDQPNCRISQLQMLSPEEEYLILHEFNDTQVDFQEDRTIAGLIEAQVEKTPDRIAIVSEGHSLSFRQLNERANQLAHYLIANGVERGMMIPVCADRSPNMITSLFAILKTGSAYVPIDPQYPHGRIHGILEDIDAKVVLSTRAVVEDLNINPKTKIIFLEEWGTEIQAQATHNPNVEFSPEDLMYVMYTSGSTGRPKGVMLRHNGVVNRLLWGQGKFNLKEGDVVLQKTTSCFDVSIWEIFWPLTTGGKMVLADHLRYSERFYLRRLIENEKITIAQFVPSMLEVWLNEVEVGDCSSLRLVICGGEALKVDLIQTFRKKLGTVDFYNLYGPTEATVEVTHWQVPKHVEQLKTVYIGKPVANIRLYVLGKAGELLPRHAIGELHLSGIQLANGYVNQPELTAQKFIPNPYGDGHYSRLYKTGDLSRWTADGEIEYLGRMDSQVKIRGFRIELSEIENAMSQMEQVRLAVVLLNEEERDGFTDKKISSFYVPNSEYIRTQEKLQSGSRVNNWEEVYEGAYNIPRELSNQEFDTASWNDSFTQQAIPEAHMREWLDDISQLIQRQAPKHVLEIGCGTGMIYYQLAGHIEKYIGNDLSKACIDQISARVHAMPDQYPKTMLSVGGADELEVSKEEDIDTVVLNSVIQYFPSETYFREVLSNSIDILNGEGRIIIGDVRNNDLLKLFKSRLLLPAISQTMSTEDFLWATDQQAMKEDELCLSPAYFHWLKEQHPEITHVSIEWKKGKAINEMILYRYNVVLHIGGQPPVENLEWSNCEDTQQFSKVLAQLKAQQFPIAIQGLYNDRLTEEYRLQQALNDKAISTVNELFKSSELHQGFSITQEIKQQLQSTDCFYQILVHEDPLKINLYIDAPDAHRTIVNPFDINKATPQRQWANIPMFYEIAFGLQKELKAQLSDQLPEYMIPAQFIPIPRAPLSSNGKVNRRLLIRLENMLSTRINEYVSPRNEIEQKMVKIWGKLLGIEKIGINDNFFELGGHSLLATRLIAAIRKDFGIELELKTLFALKDISMLAEYIHTHTQNVMDSSKNYVRIEL